MAKIKTRKGSGLFVELTDSELMAELEDGTQQAADKGHIAPLSQDELAYLYDLFSAPHGFIGVEPGKEVILSYDGVPVKLRRLQVNVDRVQVLQIYEKILGADTLEMGPIDYSFKPTKPNVSFEQPLLRQALSVTTAPVYYGSMPNLPLYSQPDGPFPNPMDLLPAGKIAEARESYEKAIAHSVKDMVYVCSAMHECGADAIILDTVGAAGDPDFLAALMATEQLKAKYPDICIELAMAGEFVLGMHGELTYQGERLAGMYAHDQVRMAHKAGATIFGPVCNTRVNKTAPWNTAHAITYTKACSEIADIPIHVNMGMGVGAMTMHEHVPVDVSSRQSKAMVEICRLDGL